MCEVCGGDRLASVQPSWLLLHGNKGVCVHVRTCTLAYDAVQVGTGVHSPLSLCRGKGAWLWGW